MFRSMSTLPPLDPQAGVLVRVDRRGAWLPAVIVVALLVLGACMLGALSASAATRTDVAVGD